MSLNVTIEGFRCHGSYTIGCDEGLTLLRGTSGIGKSTIMEAIYWCLYGTLRNIYNPLHPNRKCRVTVECPDIMVTRSTKPTSLTVTYQGKTYNTAEESQNIIQYVFGSKDVFLSSSYISQGSRHHWIELTTDEKLSCIESIAYSDSNPEIYYNKAQEYKNKCCKDYDKMEIEYKIEERLFNEKGGLNPELCMTQEEMNQICNNIKLLHVKKKDIDMNNKKRQEHETRLEQCRTMLLDMEKQLTAITRTLMISNANPNVNADVVDREYTLEDLTIMENKLQEYNNNVQYNRYAVEHNKKIEQAYNTYRIHDKDGIIEKLNTNGSSTPLIQDVIRYEIEMKRYVDWLNNINMYSDVKDLNIQELEKDLRSLIIHKNNETIRRQIETYDEHLLHMGDEDLQYKILDLKNKISRYRSGKRFKCPECMSELELSSTNLIKVEHVCIEDLEKEYKELTLIHDKQQKVRALKNKLQDIDGGMTYIESIKYNEIELNNLISKYKKYKSLGIVNKPKDIQEGITSVLLTHWNNYKTLGNKMPLKDISELGYDKKFIDVYKNNISKKNHIMQSIDKIKKDMEQYTNVINSIPKDVDTIIELDKQIVSLNDRYSSALHNNSQKMQYDKLVSIYNKLNELYTSKYYIEYIITCISHTEYTMISDTIELFNRTLEDVVASLFDEPLTLRIELLKTNKQNKSKAQIHLQITYKGMDITNINQLSGGEGTRISIALLIAFHVIHPTPFILIDESLSNINHQLREQCCNSIKKYCHVPCIMVLHETSSEGLFDNIIELS